MLRKKALNLACPLDGTQLLQAERQFVCTNGHSFDLARQGYLNLLPVQHKKSKSPGDSKAMIEARRRFLDTGIYQPIAHRLIQVIDQYLPDSGAFCLLDAGCGEGYYLDNVCSFLAESGLEASLIGLDISKEAIVSATKRNQQVTWLVASNKQPPLLPDSVDLILCMFGFPVYESFAQVLKPGGKIVLVEAAPKHLIELRQVVYDEVKQRGLPSLQAAEQSGFTLIHQENLCFSTDELQQAQIADLLQMTPHLYRANQQGKARATELKSIVLTVDVSFRLLQIH